MRAAIPAVCEALEAGILQGGKAWQWSRAARAEEPALARRLLERAVATGLEDSFVAAALHDAMGLRLDAEAAALMTRVQARANDPAAQDVRILTIEEIPTLSRSSRRKRPRLRGCTLTVRSRSTCAIRPIPWNSPCSTSVPTASTEPPRVRG
ncbi:MAG: hypothetical protein RQ833_12310 [Sphingomonadaceae bacterium]|nr:hypothetical protein [Sphingomonadaceae bacterium]